jgi:anti-anti-sigma regulatory factor
VGITLEHEEQRSLICLEGTIDIGGAAELKALLAQAIQAGKPVRVRQAGATDLDVTAAQLLWAAEREAKNAGVAFAFEGEMPEPAWDALAHAGIPRFTIPSETE